MSVINKLFMLLLSLIKLNGKMLSVIRLSVVLLKIQLLLAQDENDE
jgi:hypothetical protein